MWMRITYLLLASVLLTLSGSLFAQDTSCGIIWYPPIQLSDDTISSVIPRVALSGDDTVHVTWETNSPNYTIMKLPYRRSIDGGAGFGVARDLLIDSTAFPFRTSRPFILARHDRVWIFFTGSTESFPPIYMMYSANGGTEWNSVVAISTDRTGYIYSATQSQSGQAVALVYPPHVDQDQPPKIFRSTNDGETWTRTNEDLDDYAQIALTPGSLHLVQHTARNNAAEVEYRRSSDLGSSWQLDTVLSTTDGIYSDLPAIAGYQSDCGTELLTAWRDVKYGGYGFAGASIISRTSLSNGQTWLPEILQTTFPNGYNPSIVVHGNTRAVGWDAEVVAFDSIHAIVRASNSSLHNFCPPTDLTDDEWGGGGVQVAVSSHAIHVAYEAKVGSTFRIFYRRGEFISSNATLSLPTGLLEFDTTEVSCITTDTIMVSNTGTGTLAIGTAISDNEHFSVTPESMTVAPSAQGMFYLHYTPKTLGSHSGKIIFYHNGQSATGGSPDCFAVTGTGKYSVETIAYRAGEWNMVSTPFIPAAVTKLPSMFSYEGQYKSRDTMISGRGYWAKPDSFVTYRGVKALTDTIEVTSEWNMIGTLWKPVAITNIATLPGGIIASGVFGYNGFTYTPVDSLYPGHAYWIRVSEPGKLILSAGGALASPAARLRIVSTGDLPPFPPSREEEKRPLPTGISLQQNYPNPFNPTTTISYTLREDVHVTLRVYDMLGREVATLVDGIQSAGFKSVMFEAGNVPSGVYTYQLNAGAFSRVQKMLITK